MLPLPAAYAGQQTPAQTDKVSVTVEVQVTKQTFVPGIYAQYAAELLGIAVGTEQTVSTKVTSVKIEPSRSMQAVKMSERQMRGSAKLSAPLLANKSSSKNKAAEAAKELLSVREQRINIVTGNTDATYSGQALGDAVKYLDSREKELLALFEGSSSTTVQNATLAVTPDQDHLKCVVFRLDDDGLHDSMEFNGKPWYLEFIPAVEEEEEETAEEEAQEPEPDSKRKKSKKTPEPVYKSVSEVIPGLCTVVLWDGNTPVAHLDVNFPQLERTVTRTIKIQ